MDPLTIATIAAPVVGGLIGNQQASRDRDAARDLRNQALAQLAGINTPKIEDMLLNLQRYQSAGTLSPEQLQTINAQNTELQNIGIDQALRSQQMEALNDMSQVAKTGVTDADKAAFELNRRAAAAEAQARQNQVLQNMQQRGLGGSGAELIANLQGAQSSADRLQQANLEEVKARQNARLQALQQQAAMAGNLRSQDYGELSNKALAQDRINQLNAANANRAAEYNVSARNTAQEKNLLNAQSLANANVDIANKQQSFNKNLNQVDFENKLNLGKTKSGALTESAAYADKRGSDTAGMWGTIGQGAGGLLAAMNKK